MGILCFSYVIFQTEMLSKKFGGGKKRKKFDG